MPVLCENTGSAARDFAMLERNLLSHVRLASLLLLLAASVLLQARLPSSSNPTGITPHSSGTIPLASIQVSAAIAAIGAGIWEYRRGYKDMQDMKGFLTAVKYVGSSTRNPNTNHVSTCRPHFYVMAAVTVVVFATSIVLISDQDI
jgi:hypothetical protein